MKIRSTQRKNSAVARASQSAGRPNYTARSGGLAALLDGTLPFRQTLESEIEKTRRLLESRAN
ncbi:MAG: hypothetical protein ACLPYZ_12980 [Limisphaerales bacterium]